MTHQGHGRFIFPGRRARLPPSLFILPRLRLARRQPRPGLPRLGLMKHWTCSRDAGPLLLPVLLREKVFGPYL